MKTHLAVSEERNNGLWFWCGTLCGRSSGKSTDGVNAEVEKEEVTCELCKKIIATTNHWANRRYLQPKKAAK